MLLGALVFSAFVLMGSAVLAIFSADGDRLGWDLRVAYLPAADAILAGDSPYPDLDDPDLDLPRSYVYPPQIALALVPISGLSPDVATFLLFIASGAALVGTLALVGVRDARCYLAVLVWAPTWNSLDTLNVSAVLALGAGLVWRYRSTVLPLAIVLGLMVSIKLFIWPLLAWIALTRRFAAAGLAVVVGVAVTLCSWAVVGFEGLFEYPRLLVRVGGQESFAVPAMAAELGLDSELGQMLALAIGAAGLVFAARVARRVGEERGFALAFVAVLALSPVVWIHYLTLLIAPLGVLRPRFSVVWLLPIVLWVSPRVENGDGVQPFVPALVVALILFALLWGRDRDHDVEAAEW